MKELKELPRWFSDHPLTKEIIRTEEATITEKRTAALREIRSLKEKYATDRAGAEADIKAITQAVKTAREALDEAQRNYGLVCNRKVCLAADFERLRRAQETVLFTTYPEEINLFIKEMLDKLSEIHKSFSHGALKGKKHLWKEDEPELHSSNAPAIKAAHDFIMAAIREAETLKTADLSNMNVTEMLQGLRAGIPIVDDFTTIEIVRPDPLLEHLQSPLISQRPRLDWFNGELQPVDGWV